MAQKKNQFRETMLEKLEASLEQLKNSIGESEQAHTSFTTQNMVILSSSKSSCSQEDELINNLIRINPARFFLVVFSESLPSQEYKVSIRCEIVSKEERICSEIIKIECGLDSVSTVASILRSHLLTGVSTDLMIADPAVLNDAVAINIVSMAERVIYDGQLIGGLRQSIWLKNFSKTRIDLAWLRLSPWRETVRMLFEIPSMKSRLANITKISVGSSSGLSDKLPLDSLYMSGWILGCLGLEVEAFGFESFECSTRDGRKMDLGFFTSEGPAGLNQLRFSFVAELKDGAQGPETHLVRVGDSIECVATGITGFRTTQAIKQLADIELLKRFFLVGTSVNQYDGALSLAFDIENLKKGVSFN